MEKVWKPEINGVTHLVTLSVGWDTRRVILVDGKKIVDDTPYSNLGSKYKIKIEDKELVVVISRSYLKMRTEYDLYIDDKHITAA